MLSFYLITIPAGVDGLLKLMEGQEDRECGFVAAVGYADDEGVRVFEEPVPYFGTLTKVRRGGEGLAVGKAWGDTAGDLFEVFEPSDSVPGVKGGQTLAEMSTEELAEYRRSRRSAFRLFAEWYRGAAGAPR